MEEAFAHVRMAAEAFPRVVITIALNDPRAIGAVTAAAIACPAPVPPVACSRLDGFAVRAGAPAGTTYAVAARVRPGDADGAAVGADAAAWVTTGAPMPAGTDAVIGVEASCGIGADGADVASAGVEAPHPSACARVRLSAAARPGDNVRVAGSDASAGEELLPAHHRLAPADVGLLVSAGLRAIAVFRRPIVGVLSTGDELAALEDEGGGAAGGAYRPLDSNRPMLAALVDGAGGDAVDLGVVRDDAAAVTSAIQFALGRVDVLITTGGVSMGDRDFVKPALEALAAGGGGRVRFGRLNMKPGKPATFAVLAPPPGAGARGHDRLVFAFPGNPVSAWVCAHALALPALRVLGGVPWTAAALGGGGPARVTVLDGVALDGERPEFHRAVVWTAPPPGAAPGAPWALWARSTGAQASSRLASAGGAANALLWLPRASTAAASPAVAPPHAQLLQPPFIADAFLVAPVLVGSGVVGAALPGSLCASATLRPLAAGGGTGAGGGDRCGCGVAHGDEGGGPHAVTGAPPPPATPHALPEAVPAATAPPAVTAAALAAAHGPPPPAPPAPVAVHVFVLTVSDRCARGEAADVSGPLLSALATDALRPPAHGAALAALAQPVTAAVVPDDAAAIAAAVGAWTTAPPLLPAGAARLVLTTGGTGFGPRDVTPEALRPLITRPAHGLVHALLAAGARATPLAALSRYEAGGVGEPGARTLLVQLPGSAKAVRESMAALAPLLPHVLALMGGL